MASSLLRRLLLTTPALVAAVISSPVTAMAAPAPASPPHVVTPPLNAALQHASEARHGSLVRPSEFSPTSFTAITAAGRVVLPRRGADPLSLDAGRGLRLRMSLPTNSPVSTVTSDGSVVYPGRDVSVATQVCQDGSVRVLLALANQQAPRSYRFDLNLPRGARLQREADGGVTILAPDGVRPMGRLAAPWARDAHGLALATSYRVEGSAVIQTVDTRGAVFPVIADPDISFGWFIYIRYSKSEVQRVPDALLNAGSAQFFEWLCSEIPNRVLAGACALVSTSYVGAVYDTFGAAKRAHQCVELKWNYTPAAVVGWRRYSC
jgi:hypothetical protein